ncbi:luciferase, partial [Natronoarchaeum mannanilyticum]
MLRNAESVGETGIDAAALKPTECDVARAADLPVGTVTIDYEGREHLPTPESLAGLAEHLDVRVTTPVRADGFDPLGDDALLADLPESVGNVLVAGHPAYLTDEERRR